MWVAVILLCANTLATSCEMRANTGEFFFSKALCEANAFNYGRMLKNKGYGVVPVCFKVGKTHEKTSGRFKVQSVRYRW
jgi:hypothetical protein